MWGCIICGIVGLISRRQQGFFAKDLDLFEHGLVIDTMRGKDSVGAFTAFRNKQAMAIKHGSNPFELFKTKEWSQFRGEVTSRGRFVIGHNRAATRGELSTDNAHPFVEENIILVHNGTIFNQEQLTTTKVDVDSNAIAHALVENEPEEVFPYIHGAFACVWYDTTKQKLFMLRNEQRPLCLIEMDDAYIVSSEPWIMAMPAQRQERKLGNMIDITPGDLYAFDMEGKYTVTKLDLTKKVKRSTTTASSTTATSTHSNGNGNTVTEGFDESEDVPFFEAGTTSQSEETSPERTSLLRQALMEQRRRKMLESSPSTSCALTQRSASSPLTSTTESDSPSNLIGMNEQSNLIDGGRIPEGSEVMVGWAGPTMECHPTDDDKEQLGVSKNVINSPFYPVGRVVLVRILKNTSDFRSRVRFEGKLMEPGMEMVTVTGFVPNGTMLMPTTLCTGQIFFTKVSVHGPEVFLTDVKRCDWTPVHTTEVPQHVWNIAFRECQCNECDSHLKLADKAFTSVSTKAIFNKTRSGIPINTITCVCADCIQDKLPEGPYRESFIAKRRNLKAAHSEVMRSPTDPRPPVQNGLAKRVTIVEDADGTLRVQSTPTVH